MDTDLHDHIRQLESALLQPGTRSSEAGLREILSENFLEIGESGRTYSKDEVIKALSEEQTVQSTIHDFRIVRISDALVQALYLVEKTDANTRTIRRSMRSSLWQFHNGRWVLLFHQGTPVGSLQR